MRARCSLETVDRDGVGARKTFSICHFDLSRGVIDAGDMYFCDKVITLIYRLSLSTRKCVRYIEILVPNGIAEVCISQYITF